jgi:hypothetical protein
MDELSFILYNVSIYQVFCGSNLLIAYENLVKVPFDYSHFYISDETFSFYKKNNWFHLLQIHFFKFNDTIFLISDNFNIHSLSLQLTDISDVERVDNIYLVYFDTVTNRKGLVEFEVLQNKLYINPGETTLAFFRVVNKTDTYLNGFSLYVVSPHEFTPFINKIQCFCYEELLLYPQESVDLPVLFYLDPEIKNVLFNSKEIVIEYILII